MPYLASFALIAILTSNIGAPAPARRVQAHAKTALDSLAIGHVELTVGMDEQAALAALRREFHVERARGEGEDWAILRSAETIAVVSFSNGKLTRASKTWYSTSDRDVAALANRLYSLADEFNDAGHIDCTLSARPYRTAGVEGKIVTLSCGPKSIQFNQSRMAHGGIATSLREVLQ